MDFGQVEAFVQVATHRSFSRAAEALGLTQPSITARIQSLERELGEELFERGGRGVKLTDAGNAFLPYIERLLQTLQEGRDAVEEVRNAQLGSLRLGSAITISTYVLPKILHNFCRRHPGVDVVIRTGRSEQVLHMLLADEVQVGLARSLTNTEVETIALYDDEIVLVAPPSHPFARGTPTVAESGIPGYHASSWNGVSVPARTPRPIIDRLYKEFAAAVNAPDVKQKLQEMGIDAKAYTPAQTRKLMISDIAKWKAVIERAKIPRQ